MCFNVGATFLMAAKAASVADSMGYPKAPVEMGEDNGVDLELICKFLDIPVTIGQKLIFWFVHTFDGPQTMNDIPVWQIVPS